MISSGGLTDQLGRLEKAGLVRRRPSPEDARSVMVELTAQGRARIEEAFRADMSLENQLLIGLTDEEHRLLVKLLRKLALHTGA
jgi:DNA-binding MarR family transcriptional regulator